MAIILGIDAAWTTRQPSGVALLDTARPLAQCLVAAPSYAAFLQVAGGGAFHWQERHTGGEPPVAELLEASAAVAGQPVDVIAIDMPVSREAISGRRAADQAVSREFGGRWCAAHTPNETRPGPLGARLTETFMSLGFPVATTATMPGSPRQLVEVYPHPALLALLERDRRVPYKVSKVRTYWPKESPQVRISLLLKELQAIEAALTQELGAASRRIALYTTAAVESHQSLRGYARCDCLRLGGQSVYAGAGDAAG